MLPKTGAVIGSTAILINAKVIQQRFVFRRLGFRAQHGIDGDLALDDDGIPIIPLNDQNCRMMVSEIAKLLDENIG